MGNHIKISGIDVHQFQWRTPNIGNDDYYNGFNAVYQPGEGALRTGYVLQIHTDAGFRQNHHR